MTTVGLVLAAAALGAAVMALALVLVWRRVLLPDLERRLDERLARANEEFAQTVERSVRKGFVDALSSTLPSREVLQDTTITVARTGMEMIGESLTTLLGRRGGRRAAVREPKGGGGVDVPE